MRKLVTGACEQAVEMWNKYKESSFSIDDVTKKEYSLYDGVVEDYLKEFPYVVYKNIILNEETVASDIISLKIEIEKENTKKCIQIVEYPNVKDNQCCVCKQIKPDDEFDSLDETLCEDCVTEILTADIS